MAKCEQLAENKNKDRFICCKSYCLALYYFISACFCNFHKKNIHYARHSVINKHLF